MYNRGVIAGSFDPITNGHTWLIEQALKVVDELHIVIGHNPAKKYMFSEEERTDMVEKVVNQLLLKYNRRVFTASIDKDLLINFAHDISANFLIRGIRNTEDFNYEAQMLLINRKIQPGIETLFFVPPRELTEVSSSTVKGLVGFNGWEEIVTSYVDPYVLHMLKEKRK